MLRLLVDFNNPDVDTLLVWRRWLVWVLLMSCQRVKQAAMPKPDKVLRSRPLREVAGALSKLKRVVLFHPKPIVMELAPGYCVCKKGAHRKGEHTSTMIQCEGCYEWFHYDCVGLKDNDAAPGDEWRCEWCRDDIDKEGFQRWRSGRKMPKKRHHRDMPKHKGAVLGQDAPKRYSAQQLWEGKVAEVKELARRAAVKKRKLTDAVELLVAGGGHHVYDAEGMAGLVARPVDPQMVDEAIHSGLVNEKDCEGDD